MGRNQMRAALLKVSIMVLMGSSWVFCSFIFSTRPEEVDSDALTSLVRLPASLPAQLPEGLPGVFAGPLRVNEPIEMEIVKLNCWDTSDESEVETSARWIRLVGKSCRAKVAADADAVVVRNLTNGYVATVFPTQTLGMTTDFIPLQAGKNDILIRLNQGPGVTIESQFSFNRE